MPHFSFGVLGRMIPKWGQPVARRALGAIRAMLDRFGIAAAQERGYRRRLVTHAFSGSIPRIRTSIAREREPTDVDIGIATRVLDAWHRVIKAYPAASNQLVDDVWTGLARHYHGELLALLEKRNPRAVAEYLCNMSRHDATVGITQGSIEFRKASASGHYRQWGGLLVLDRLVALAEIVGVLRVENPEQGRWAQNLHVDIDELIGKLEATLGIEIVVPDIEGGLFGLDSKSGRIHFRDVTALYAAWRIRALTDRREAVSICEIGGGIGRVAYYCAKFGIDNYVIYDLPLVNVLQGYFLVRAMPGARIVLYGEQRPADGRAIRVLPGWALSDAPPKAFDLVLNQDSFPEIDSSAVQAYLREIRRTTRAHLLSINHEAETPIGESGKHLVVSNVIEEVGGFDRIYRFPCWVRAGYMEELYKVS